MSEAQRKQKPEQESDLGLGGFEPFFEDPSVKLPSEEVNATTSGDSSYLNGQVGKLVDKLTELITLNVDQRVETARIANQLIENQRQLVATQQILIRLMERSIELTRHISAIEEKLPAVFELPAMVEQLRMKVAQMEGIELD
ncbi:MAG: hypothetical protein K2X77_16875 [Candidatus Obscuribacterales bacterium]|jgi:hypothetical protein|nr:hypothetical protein [Candidatus Obscuribacterales bacterium]